MAIPETHILWMGDGPLNAVDEIADRIAGFIDSNLSDCDEEDQSSLNYVVAQMCCLASIGHHQGGMTDWYEKLEDWREQTLRIFHYAWPSPSEDPDTYKKELKHVKTVLDSLFEGADNSTIESARRPWKRS